MDKFPASFAQQRLWFLDQFEPGSSAYNIPTAWRMWGPLDIGILQRSLDEIVQRHETLRTRFAVEGDEVMQIIEAGQPVALPLVDLSSAPDAGDQLRGLIDAEAAQAFDLARGPLIRTTLIRLGPGEHVLLLTLHHIIADGWSMGVLLRELDAVYGAHRQGQGSSLPPIEIQYADFSVWQRDWLQGDELAQRLDHWRTTLQGAPALLELPTDRPRAPRMRHEGACLAVEFGPALTERLRHFAARHQSTTFMVMAAVFNVLLQRYSGQNDICIGYPVANRVLPDTEAIIGFFANTLVLRTQVDASGSFDRLLTQVREAVLEADLHQDLPFEKLVQELHPERALSHSPLFQVMLSMNNTGSPELAAAGLEWTPMAQEARTAKFDLTLNLADDGAQMTGEFEFRTDLFDRSTITRMADHLRTLLESALDSPGTRLKQLQMLPAAEREQLRRFGQSGNPVPAHEGCVHEQFERHASANPDATAVLFGQQRLSYGELNRRANQVAHHLIGLGCKPDTLVALCVERSLDMAAGMLGILKAGGAYVPLDPEYPRDRLDFMLRDTAASIVLTQARVAHCLPPCSATLVQLDLLGTDTAASLADPRLPITPDHLAYCIYTSGSTGRPKGALNTHRGLANLVRWYFTDEAGAGPGERTVLGSSLSFDLTQKNILGTLAAGACLVIPCGEAADAAALGDALTAHRPTRINCAPSAYRYYAAGAGDLSSLRTVVLGGEPIEASLASQLHARGVTLVNSYGPTECADVALSHVQRPGLAADEVAAVPLGRPLDGVEVLVLTPDLELAPLGLPGELHIAGIGVGRGYLHRPELTAERFVPHPFGAPGTRLYKTGDRARVRPDGNLEFLGRLDNQVKVRGHRIELGEVDAALLACDGVAEAAVAVHGHDEDKSLVAYVVCSGEPKPAQALRAQLGQRLPEFMLPTRWVFLDRMPLNANGKLDRLSLPAPADHASPERGDAQPSWTATETTLAPFWCEVLKREQVGPSDDFFALGGHSISAARVTYRVNKTLGLSLGVSAMFEHRTLRQLAAHIDSLPAERSLPSPALHPTKAGGACPLSPGQEWLWAYYQFDELVGGRNILPVCLELHGEDMLAAAEAALQRLAARHRALLTRVRRSPADADRLECHEDTRLAPLTVIRLTSAQMADKPALDRMIEDDLRMPFGLIDQPLVRASLYRGPEPRGVLAVALHHFVSDGWSLSVVKEDLLQLLHAQVSDAPPPATEVRDYRDYATDAARRLAAGFFDRHFAYWTDYLRDSPGHLRIRGEGQRPARFDFKGASLSAALAAQTVAGIDRICQAEGVTEYIVLMAGYLLTLHRMTGSADVLVRSPVSTRGSLEEERSVGFYMQSIVVRSKLGDRLAPEVLLRTVASDVRRALDHSRVPPLHLAHSVGPNADEAHCSRFQYLFNHYNFPQDTTGLAVDSPVVREYAAIKTAPPYAKFDIDLSSERQGADIRYRLTCYRSALSEVTMLEFSEAFMQALNDIVGTGGHGLGESLDLRGTAASQQMPSTNLQSIQR